MPLDAISSAAEWDLSRFTSGVIPEVDGSVVNTPNNSVKEQFLRELSADGAPPAWDAVRGPEMEGYDAYITRLGALRGTLQRHNSSPIDPTNDAYQFARPVVSGGRPPVKGTPGVVNPHPDYPLEAPVVTRVAADKAGFPQGVYGAAISFVGSGGSHTETTDEGPTVTVSADGKLIEFALIQDADRDLVKGQGLWLTEPAATAEAIDWTTLRLQDVAPNRGRTYTLSGPYKWKARKAPNTNETAIGKPEPYRYHRDYELRGNQGKDLQVGRWLFYRVESTKVGDSLPSRHLGDRNVAAEKKGHGYVFHPKKLHDEAIGYKIYAQDTDEAINPPFYQLMRVRRGDKARHFNREERPVFFGIKDTGEVVTTDGADEGGVERARYVLVSSEPPTEDASGIEGPSGEIDPPVAVGLGNPAPGDYLVGYGKRFRDGRVTPVSPLVKVTTTTALPIIRMQFPPRANKIPNALYGQLDGKGLPFSWEIKNSANAVATASTADIGFERAGVLFLQATALANTGRYPNATQPVVAGKPAETLIAVDKDRIETIAGFLEVSGRTSGNGYAELIQYDDTAVEVGTPLTLATMAVNGKQWVEKTIAGSAVPSDLTLNDATAYVGVRWGAEGNPRTLRVRWHSQVWAPQKGIPRRFEEAASALEHAVASNDPAIPYPSSHVLTIGLPPATAADVSAAEPPLEVTSYEALAAGSEPAGWTQNLTNAQEAGAYTPTTYPFYDGATKTYRVRSDNTGAKSTANMQKTFTPPANTLANVFPLYIERGPTRNPSSIVVGILRAASGQDMARLLLKRVNGGANPFELHLITVDKSGKERSTRLRGGLKNGDRVEVEVVIGGGGTTAGSAATSLGINGASRSPGPGQTALDFGSRLPTTVLAGGSQESHSDTKWTFQYGKLKVTSTGYPAIENSAPALTAIPQPDAPLKDGTTLSGPASAPVDYTITTSNRASAGVAVTVNRTGALAAERTLAQIRTSAGTELVGLYMKTDHTVEVRKGAAIYQASAAVPTGTNYRFDLIVKNAGTSAGEALLYRTAGTGPRELFVQATGLDLSTTQAQRATVPDNAELTESNVLVTNLGEYEGDQEGPDNLPAYQEYVSILAPDVIEGQDDVGFDLEEFFVKPGIQRTAAVYIKADDLPTGAAPFTLVEYDDNGAGTDIKSVYKDGTTLTLPGGNGWVEVWTTYTPTQKRIRWEHRGMTGGRYAAYKRLDAEGNLTTRALRDAKRNEGRAISGTFSAVLNARIPAQSGTQMAGQWQEARQRLQIVSQTPTGASVTARFRSSASLAGLAGAPWQTDAQLVPDLEWVEAEGTLTNDGVGFPVVPPGGVHLFYKCFQPVLLRQDRTPLPGGVYIGGGSGANLPRPYSRSMFDAESVGDRAAPRAITATVGRVGGFPMSIFSPEALDIIQSDAFLEEDWYIESPHHGLVMRVRFYDVPSEATTAEGIEYPLLDEGMRFWVPKEVSVERAEVVESGLL